MNERSQQGALAADERCASIGKLLSTPGPTVGENNVAFHWRADCDYLYTELSQARELLEQAAPHLRSLASQCEACQGAGEVIHGDPDHEWGEQCKHCKPLWDLIERIEPPAPQSQPQPAVEVEDDLPF